jgi:hypothetical protein
MWGECAMKIDAFDPILRYARAAHGRSYCGIIDSRQTKTAGGHRHASVMQHDMNRR